MMTAADGAFDADVRRAAQRLLDSGRIADVRVLQNGRVVTGIIHPDPTLPGPPAAHRVYIRYRPQPSSSGAFTLEGECSCGERSPCPHVAAVAMSAAGSPDARALERRRDHLDAVPASGQQSLCYRLLDIDGVCHVSVWVTTVAAGRREIADGARPFARRTAASGDDYPRYVADTDRPILEALPRLPQDQRPLPADQWPLRGDTGFHLLERIVATGRALWQASHGTPLAWSAPRELTLEWRTAAAGEQRLHAGGSAALHLILSVETAIYVDRDTAECGPLQIPYPVDLLRRYWGQPGLTPEHVAQVIDGLAGLEQADRFPRPRALRVVREPLSTLCGSLTLSAGPEATLHFLYNGHPIASRELPDAQSTLRHLDDPLPGSDGSAVGGDVHEIERDPDAERRLRGELQEVMPEPPRTRDAWLRFLVEGVPTLRKAGWTVSIDAAFPHRLAAVDDWYVDLSAQARPEWFDLELGVLVDGRQLNLLPALVEYLQTFGDDAGASPLAAPAPPGGDHVFIALEDGRHLPVPATRLQRIAHTLVELFDRDALNDRRALSLPRNQASRLAADAPTLRSADPSLRALIGDLANFRAIAPLQAPPECRATLREYQKEGLGWLQFLRRQGLGGILADDMGLGKTVQTLAHLATEKAAGRLVKPALIVAPVSVLGNWQHEIRRFTPTLTSVTLHGARRGRWFASLDTFDVIIMGYASLVFDAAVLEDRTFSVVILDEAQTIKNPHAKVSRAARALCAEQRLCLTGTPMENHLGDLWSLFDFVQPGLLGTERGFLRHYRTPIEKGGNGARAAALKERIAPFLLRRTKDAVARELPRKTEIIESIVMEEPQRDLYDGIRLSMHRRVREAIAARGLARSRITLLGALLKLRQVCCDPRLLGADASAEAMPAAPDAAASSAKLDWLATALPELIADGRRILLFSQFTSMLALIETLVEELRIPYCLLTGDTEGRTAVVDRFQSGGVPLFLLSLKAGGAGMNLTAADTVIHYDPWWNPAVEMQATDRAHRIGQDKPVFVYKLIAQGTVEEKILKLQAEKQALVSQLYDAGDAALSLLSADDLDGLFNP
jgi:superfamily II DNA or RNA helicase